MMCPVGFKKIRVASTLLKAATKPHFVRGVSVLSGEGSALQLRTRTAEVAGSSLQSSDH